MKIEKTTNYDKFKTIRGNRELNKVHLKKLIESIGDNNLLEANPIIVNYRFEVLDGQHRLEAAKRLGIPIYYTVLPHLIGGSLREVQMLNSNARSWTMKNFLDSFVERGNENYIILKDWSEKNGLSTGIALLLLTGGQARSKNGNRVIESFKNGEMKVTQRAFADRVAADLRILTPLCEDLVTGDREFVTALTLTYSKGFKFETLVGKLKLSGIKIPLCRTRRQYIRQIEDVLSWKSKVPARII